MYSRMAESPDASDMERCMVAALTSGHARRQKLEIRAFEALHRFADTGAIVGAIAAMPRPESFAGSGVEYCAEER